eukprot:819352-Amphidinium_carterae.1
MPQKRVSGPTYPPKKVHFGKLGRSNSLGVWGVGSLIKLDQAVFYEDCHENGSGAEQHGRVMRTQS